MAPGGSPKSPSMGAPALKALYLLLLLHLLGGLLSTTAHVARATAATTTTTTTRISSCGEGGGGTRCPGSLEPVTSGPPGGAGDPERGLIGIASAAPTPSPVAFGNFSVAAAECEEESTACLADEECQGCYEIASGLSNSEEFDTCREAYLRGVPSSSSLSEEEEEEYSSNMLSVLSTCDIVGAMYCCSNEVSESDCLAGDSSTLYWACVFETYGCELEEVACLALGESYRSDDDDVGGRASGNSLNGAAAGKAPTPWSSGVGCAVVAALVLATAFTTTGMNM